jgi:hypothetical protein
MHYFHFVFWGYTGIAEIMLSLFLFQGTSNQIIYQIFEIQEIILLCFIAQRYQTTKIVGTKSHNRNLA